ncbi:MAG: cell division protein ZapA [Pseudomonadota bacterium]
MEKPIRVKILDHEYLLKSDEDEELVQEVAQFVNSKLMDIGKSTSKLSEAKVAILAAFHIASDYFQLLRERDGMVRDIQERARSLNYQIDSMMR